MNSADDVFKRQAAMSQWKGAARVADWQLVVGLVILFANLIFAFSEGENLLTAIVTPLLIIALSLRMREIAKVRSRELERGLP